MDAGMKKTALRMIPYGLYILTAKTGDNRVAASTVNWVTQTSREGELFRTGKTASLIFGKTPAFLSADYSKAWRKTTIQFS